MAQISFLAGQGNFINDLSGSGLGFYGISSYGSSVAVGNFQDNTYITDSTGTSPNAVKVNNVKWTDPASGMLAGGDNRYLRAIPNYLSTLNIRFTNSTPVKVQNAQLRIFDRQSIDNPPSGVIPKVAIMCHPWNTQSPDGSGSIAWYTPGGSGSIVNFSDVPACVSPGSGGFSSSGANTTDIQHDFYVAISCAPSAIGSKLFALYTSLEFY